MSPTDDEDRELRSRGDLIRERKATEKRLSDLATVLAGLSIKQVDRLDLDERIVMALDDARRMTSYSAKARQLRVVRRELRASDSRSIQMAVDDLLNPRVAPPPKAPTMAQSWAERFLGEGHDAVESFLLAHAHADRQRLRGLLRNVQKADAKKVAKARKTLVAAIDALIKELR